MALGLGAFFSLNVYLYCVVPVQMTINSILFYSSLFYSILLCFYFTMFCSVLFY